MWGLATGDMQLAVSVSLVFELLWLDLVPAGTFIPPNPAAANLAALLLMTLFDFHGPAEALFPILLGMPLAWLSAAMERLNRARLNMAFNTMQNWLRPGRGDDFAPRRLVHRALAQAGLSYLLFFLVCASCLAALCAFLVGRGLLRPDAELFTWGHLWLGASVGGLMSLRVPRAYTVLGCGAVAVAVLSFFG